MYIYVPGAGTFLIALKVSPRNSGYGSQLTSPIYIKCFFQYVQHEHQNMKVGCSSSLHTLQ